VRWPQCLCVGLSVRPSVDHAGERFRNDGAVIKQSTVASPHAVIFFTPNIVFVQKYNYRPISFGGYFSSEALSVERYKGAIQ